MTIKAEIPNGVEAVLAEYKPSEVADYRENPFIEALPPLLSKEAAVDGLAYYPPFSLNERDHEAHVRIHEIQRVFQYFQPTAKDLDLESRISRLIRQGYVSRNPTSSSFARQFHSSHLMSGFNKNGPLMQESFRSTQSALTLMGPSGIGKSTAIHRVLSLYPQVVVHSEYQSVPFTQYQLVWLKLDCPFDGSIKGLCVGFFQAVDRILGSNNFRKFGSARNPISAMQAAMTHIAATTGLGLLVIDEIQHLSTAKGQGAEMMLNFFVTLVNTIGVPVVLIGTNKAAAVLQSQFRQARRGSGQGDMIWERWHQDANWTLLLEGLWEYQFVRKPVPLTDDLSQALFDESQGIPDLAIKLFVMAQIRAMASKKESITSRLIRTVAKENLQLVQPMIGGLKSGDIKQISMYEDMTPIDVEGFIARESSSAITNQKIRELQDAKMKRDRDKHMSVQEQAILKLVELELEPKLAIKWVQKAMASRDTQSVAEVVKAALTLSATSASEGKSFADSQTTSSPYLESDLRTIVAYGRDEGLSAVDSLRRAGVIKTVQQDSLFTE